MNLNLRADDPGPSRAPPSSLPRILLGPFRPEDRVRSEAGLGNLLWEFELLLKVHQPLLVAGRARTPLRLGGNRGH